MPTGPDGMVVDRSSSDDDTGGAGGTKPVSGVGACPHKECRPRSPGPIDELIAALHEATLGPAHPRCHGLDPLPDDRPKVKIPPPVLKDYQVKDLMHIC